MTRKDNWKTKNVVFGAIAALVGLLLVFISLDKNIFTFSAGLWSIMMGYLMVNFHG